MHPSPEFHYSAFQIYGLTGNCISVLKSAVESSLKTPKMVGRRGEPPAATGLAQDSTEVARRCATGRLAGLMEEPIDIFKKGKGLVRWTPFQATSNVRSARE